MKARFLKVSCVPITKSLDCFLIGQFSYAPTMSVYRSARGEHRRAHADDESRRMRAESARVARKGDEMDAGWMH
eukprot:scaffold13964_cov117-Isochrysis_galbana.AAC.4